MPVRSISRIVFHSVCQTNRAPVRGEGLFLQYDARSLTAWQSRNQNSEIWVTVCIPPGPTTKDTISSAIQSLHNNTTKARARHCCNPQHLRDSRPPKRPDQLLCGHVLHGLSCGMSRECSCLHSRLDVVRRVHGVCKVKGHATGQFICVQKLFMVLKGQFVYPLSDQGVTGDPPHVLC